MHEAMIVCDEFFRIILCNSAFKKLLNYNDEDILGSIASEFIQIDKIACPICSGNTDSPYIPEKFIHQAELISKDGEKTPVKVSHSIIRDDSTDDVYYASVITLLSDSICLNQAHLDFVGTVSHELRTPLTSIKGFADTLLSAGDLLPKEQQVRFISIIKSQVDRLTRLVEDLLTVSRLESKKDNSIYKAVNLPKLIDPIVQGIRTKVPKHDFNIEIPEDLPKIWADADKLEQIMTNLIDNAAKYSFPNTTVTVKAFYSPNNTDFIDIHVIDQGVGIPQEHLPTIFTKFSRIDNSLTREVQGTGLGLYITKTLVEKMKGSIKVESSDKGTKFTVQLPVATIEKQAQEKSAQREVN